MKDVDKVVKELLAKHEEAKNELLDIEQKYLYLSGYLKALSLAISEFEKAAKENT